MAQERGTLAPSNGGQPVHEEFWPAGRRQPPATDTEVAKVARADSSCLTFSIERILSADFGKHDCRRPDSELWPAWVYCTRYSDRPSSGPRSRRLKKREKEAEEKRPRTAFTAEQLTRLQQEFQTSRYLTEQRRQELAADLRLSDSQIKIWFQNKRAKLKKASGTKNPLALQLMAQGLYNHSTSGHQVLA